MALNYLQGMAGRFGRGANTLGTMEDPRARFAQQLQAESVDTSPAFLGTGLSRLGKALVGALMMKRSMADQEAATKWLTSKMPDRKRKPTDREVFEASPELELLRQKSQPGYTGPLETKLAPDTDDVLMGKTEVDEFGDPAGIPQTLEKLNILNYLQEQHKDFPEQTEFTNPYTGRTDTAVPEDWARLPGEIDEGSRKFAEQMEQARQASMKPRPVDYAQELATGMEAYRANPMHQISDPYTRSEWLRESYRNDPELKNNWFANRLIQNMMFADIGREEEQRLHQRGIAEKKAAADLLYQRGREGKSPAQLKDIKTEYGYKKKVADAKRGDYGGAGGTFGGSREGILLNILHSADPSSKEYLMAYTETASERVKTDMHGNTIRVSPDMTPYAKPTYKGTATPAGAVPVMETPPSGPMMQGAGGPFTTGSEVDAGVVSQEVPEQIPGQATVTRDQSPREGFALEDKLRKEYDMGSKDYVSVRDAYARVVASGDNPSAAGDLALIFNYMKILDPGSVVRESEFANAAATGSFGERIKAAMGRIQEGERLSQVMRNDFMTRAKVLYEQQETSQTQLEQKYKLLAGQYDLDPNRVVIGKKRIGGFRGGDANVGSSIGKQTPLSETEKKRLEELRRKRDQ